MAQTDEIAHRVTELLGPDIPGFRYTRSRTQLRKTGKPFSDDLSIDVTSRSGASYAIAFYVGVVHADVEKFVANMEGRPVSPYDRTIFQYSVNVGKQKVLPFGGPVWWWGLPQDGALEKIGAEIRQFVTGFAFAYHFHFHELETIRDSLVNRDGLALNMHPFKHVLAIDALLSDDDHVASYLRLLQDEIDSGYHHDCNKFNGYYDRLSATNKALFPAFSLRPRKRA